MPKGKLSEQEGRAPFLFTFAFFTHAREKRC